jgi:hypothetical protein
LLLHDIKIQINGHTTFLMTIFNDPLLDVAEDAADVFGELRRFSTRPLVCCEYACECLMQMLHSLQSPNTAYSRCPFRNHRHVVSTYVAPEQQPILSDLQNGNY